jgi:hypothetical protein
MEQLFSNKSSKVFTDTINTSKYIQTTIELNNSIKFPSLIELFFYYYDHHFQLIDTKDKDLYIKQRLMELATDIDENKQDSYKKYNYNKYMNISTIQQGLQMMNTVSSMLYLSDLYNINTVIYLEGTSYKILTSDKTRKPLHIMYTCDGKWCKLDDIPDYSVSDFCELGVCLQLDVKTKDIYNRYLNPIGKYKLPELIKLANERGISTDINGKKKVKKVLYDEINLYELNV